MWRRQQPVFPADGQTGQRISCVCQKADVVRGEEGNGSWWSWTRNMLVFRNENMLRLNKHWLKQKVLPVQNCFCFRRLREPQESTDLNHTRTQTVLDPEPPSWTCTSLLLLQLRTSQCECQTYSLNMVAPLLLHLLLVLLFLDRTTISASGVDLRPRSPNSCLDSNPRPRFGVSRDITMSDVAPPPEVNQPIPVRYRARSSAHCEWLEQRSVSQTVVVPSLKPWFLLRLCSQTSARLYARGVSLWLRLLQARRSQKERWVRVVRVVVFGSEETSCRNPDVCLCLLKVTTSFTGAWVTRASAPSPRRSPVTPCPTAATHRSAGSTTSEGASASLTQTCTTAPPSHTRKRLPRSPPRPPPFLLLLRPNSPSLCSQGGWLDSDCSAIDPLKTTAPPSGLERRLRR